MAMARYCERCGAVFPLSDLFYNRVRLYTYNPEHTNMMTGSGSAMGDDPLDKELCHNCVEDLKKWLKDPTL